MISHTSECSRSDPSAGDRGGPNGRGQRGRAPRGLSVAFAAAVLMGCLAAVACSGGQAAAPACGQSHVSIVRENRAAVVFREGGDVYGCLRGGRPLALVRGPSRLTLLRLAGHFAAVAWFLTDPGGGGSTEELDVFDLSNGRGSEVSAWDRSSPGAFPDAVITPRGSIAWIERTPILPQVYRCPRVSCVGGTRHAARLDRGNAIAVHSLRLRGTRISWPSGGRRRTSSLR